MLPISGLPDANAKAHAASCPNGSEFSGRSFQERTLYEVERYRTSYTNFTKIRRQRHRHTVTIISDRRLCQLLQYSKLVVAGKDGGCCRPMTKSIVPPNAACNLSLWLERTATAARQCGASIPLSTTSIPSRSRHPRLASRCACQDVAGSPYFLPP